MTTKKVRAKVALVADAEQIAVNLGRASGVRIGDKLHVLRETPIPDPDDSNEILGTAFIRKGTMVIEEVNDKFSTARVLKTRKGFLAPAEPTFLIVDSKGRESLDRIFINVGDPVEVLIAPESDSDSEDFD